jgi:hypothetical protein
MRGLQDGLQPNLDKDEYKEPKFIAATVLKRAMRELNERADLTFRYEPIKEAPVLLAFNRSCPLYSVLVGYGTRGDHGAGPLRSKSCFSGFEVSRA